MATSARFKLEVVADSIKETNLQVKAIVTDGKSTKTTITWKCYPSSSPKNSVSYGTSSISGNGEAIKKITKLNPNTAYVIEAKMVNKPTSTSPSPSITVVITATKTVSAKTELMSRELVTEETTASTIRVKLKGLKKYPYDRQVKFFIKRKSDTEWVVKKVMDIPQSTDKAVTYLYTGLKKSTAYNIKAEYYRVEDGKSTRIGYTTRTISTTAYTPNPKPIPYITDYVVVQSADPYDVIHGLVMVAVDGSMDGYTVHLYSSEDDDTYTDLGVWADITKPKAITGEDGDTAYYKVAVVDGSSNVYNYSEPIEVNYKDNNASATIEEGQVFNITAEDMASICELLLSSYMYRHYDRVGIYNIYDLDNEYYLAVKNATGTIRDGMLVEGGEESLFQKICDLIVYMENHAGRITPLDRLVVGEKDTPITASFINSFANILNEAIRP